MIKIALNRDGSVGYIPDLVYHRLQLTVPEGPVPIRAVAPVPRQGFVAELEASPVVVEELEAGLPLVGGDSVTGEAEGEVQGEGSMLPEAATRTLAETLLGEEAPVQVPGYRYPAGWGEVDWVSEGGGEEDGEGGHGVRRERFLVGVGLVELGVGLYGPSR